MLKNVRFWYINTYKQITRLIWISQHRIYWRYSSIFLLISLNLFGENWLVKLINHFTFNIKWINQILKYPRLIESSVVYKDLRYFDCSWLQYQNYQKILLHHFHHKLLPNEFECSNVHICRDFLHMPQTFLAIYFLNKHH